MGGTRLVWLLYCSLLHSDFFSRPTALALSIPNFGFYKKDVDIQNSIIGVTKHLARKCPIVLIFDDILPTPAANRILTTFSNKGNENQPQLLIILDFSTRNLPKLLSQYETEDAGETLLKFLHILYRKFRCYTFLIWISDPRILQTHSLNVVHPGWRENDVVILATQHITRRYRSLIGARFWNEIPNIIAFKRRYDDETITNEVRVFTVLPYFDRERKKSQELDVWLVKQNQFLYNRTLFFDKFKSFHLAPLRVAQYWKVPFLIWGSYANPYMDGLDWRLIQMCRMALNFTYVAQNVYNYGRMDRNGTWGRGMMKLLRNDEVDIGIGGVAMYSELMEAFGFTRSYYTDAFNFISPINEVQKGTLRAILAPFKDDVWISVGISVFIASFTLRIVAFLDGKLTNDDLLEPNKDSEKHFKSLLNVVGFGITILCQKPYRYTPKRLSVQLIYNSIVVCNFVLGILFSGCLVAHLFKFKHRPLAETVQDVLKSELTVNIRNYNDYLQHFFETSRDPTILKLYTKCKLVGWNTSITSIDEVVRGNGFYIDSLAALKFNGRLNYMGAQGLKFYISPDQIVDHAPVGWPVRKNWPFTKKFDQILTRAVEHGFVEYWTQEFMRGRWGWNDEAWKIPEYFNVGLFSGEKRVNDSDPSRLLERRFVPLSTSHLQGAISFYVTFCLIGLSIFIIELLFACLYRTGNYLFGWMSRTLKLSKDKTKTSNRDNNTHKIKDKEGKVEIERDGEQMGKPETNEKKQGNKKTKLQLQPDTSNSSNLFLISRTRKHKRSTSTVASKYPEIIWNDFEGCDRFIKK